MAADKSRKHLSLLAELGIPGGYGTNPFLPVYTEASEVIDVEPNIVGRMQQLTPSTALAWSDMRAQAQKDAVQLLLVSGFRSLEYQAGLIRKKLEAGQLIEAIMRVNVAPGYSQHHTGNAIDIATPGCKPLLEEFEESTAFAWLQENAGNFGFLLSYPRGNPECLAYEPWHWFRTTK
jgi:D-alanyl-D-alanine carboxypeptidase